MAISGGTFRVEDDKINSFSSDMKSRNDTIAGTIGSYNSSNIKEGGLFGIGAQDNSKNANDFVGITPEMLSKITGAIDSYTNQLNSVLDQMPDAVDYTVAFRGTEVENAIKKFVTSVKEVCRSYLENLKLAESQIVESVEAQYKSSDANISEQLNSDVSAIDSSTGN